MGIRLYDKHSIEMQTPPTLAAAFKECLVLQQHCYQPSSHPHSMIMATDFRLGILELS
jgi:hypothetical protein